MNMNMTDWFRAQRTSSGKKAVPILSFPATQLLGISVADLTTSSEHQSHAMRLIADRCDTGASVSMMDLSVEAECFGAAVRYAADEVPVVMGSLVTSLQDALDLKVPQVGSGRTGVYLKAMEQAAAAIADRPVFAGVIGPFSLAGRLMGMTDILVNCYVDPDTVRATLEKAAQFLTDYIAHYKSTGASGVIMAEPAAGLLSPKLIEEFSTLYVKRIVARTQDDAFAVVYHNCGSVLPLADSIFSAGASAYHFGNAVDLSAMLEKAPEGVCVMGNIDPVSQFRHGTRESIYAQTRRLLSACGGDARFILSSGCDIPPLASWDNIDAFFQAVADFNGGK